jgi:sulfur carrier protein
MIRVKVNGESKEFDREMNVLELLQRLDIKLRDVGLAVALNGEVVPKSEYEKTLISDGDSIEIVQLVGGG